MTRYRSCRLRWTVCIFLLHGVTLAWATELPLINPSFEVVSRPLDVGEQTNGVGGTGVDVATRFPFSGAGLSWDAPVQVPGWRTRVPPPGSPDVLYAGVLHPPSVSGQPFVSGQDGQNVFAIQVAQAGQAIDTELQPNTRYQLDFLGGIGRFDFDYFLAVSLIAVDDLQTLPLENQPGVTRLAITQGLFPDPATFGTLLPYSLEYTTPDVLPPDLQGRLIGVHLYGSDGIPRVLYDDFRLQAFPLVLRCDFNGSGGCDGTDLDLMFAAGPLASGIAVTPANAQFDLTGDGRLDLQDRDAWLADASAENGLASAYLLGDANLDGTVDGTDFLAWNGAKFSASLLWSDGNFDGDGVVDGADFLAWNAHKFTGSTAVPEPSPAGWMPILFVLASTAAGRTRGQVPRRVRAGTCRSQIASRLIEIAAV